MKKKKVKLFFQYGRQVTFSKTINIFLKGAILIYGATNLGLDSFYIIASHNLIWAISIDGKF